LPSPLKVAWYRMCGARIGKRVTIGLLSVIEAKSIEIGDDSCIGHFSFLKLREDLRLGKRVRINMMVAMDTGSVTIDDDTTIMEQVIVGGMLTPRSKLTIGKRVKVFPHAFLNPTQEIDIEDDVGVGGSNYIFTHGSWQSVLDGFMASFAPVRIKKNAWLPWRVFVMPGVTIGENAIIGPGAVVNRSVPDGGVASGVPAEVVDHKGRHIRKLNTPYRVKLVKNILTEFAEYETWLKRPCRVVEEGETGALLDHGSRRIRFGVSLDGPGDLKRGEIAVALGPMEGSARQACDAAGVLWFDLMGKATPLTRDPLGVELRNYFSRYGIRFDILD
jgi:acetyltransferase-like isoleucine patch superfamily enzyme